MRPGLVGVALTLRVQAPARFLKRRFGKVLAVFNNQPTGVLARYLGVQGPTGSVVFEVANYPTGSSIYIAPKLRGCNPIPTPSGPIGMKTPPCPAR